MKMYVLKIPFFTLLVSLECNSLIHSFIHAWSRWTYCVLKWQRETRATVYSRDHRLLCVCLGYRGGRGLGPHLRHTSFQKLPWRRIRGSDPVGVSMGQAVWLSGRLAVYGRERKSVMLILLMQILVFCSLWMFAFIMIFKILHYNIRSDCWAFLVDVWSCTAETRAQLMSRSSLSLLVYFWLLKFLQACSWDPTIWIQGLQTYK